MDKALVSINEWHCSESQNKDKPKTLSPNNQHNTTQSANQQRLLWLGAKSFLGKVDTCEAFKVKGRAGGVEAEGMKRMRNHGKVKEI